MKKYWQIMAAALCALALSACAVQENKTADTRESKNIATSESKNIATSESKNLVTSENRNIAVTESEDIAISENNSSNVQEDETEMKMQIQIGGYTFTATLEQNQAVKEFVEMMKNGPITIEMSDYSGFEKVGPLGKRLTTDDHQTTTTEGDIVLYNGNQIVIFYGSNSWSYTRIGKIEDLTNWKKALGSKDVTAVFTAAE